MKKSNDVKEIIRCGKCGKTVAWLMKDGSVYIAFGRKRNISEDRKEQIDEQGGYILKRKNRFAMEVEVKGAVKIRCTSPYCDHTTIVL